MEAKTRNGRKITGRLAEIFVSRKVAFKVNDVKKSEVVEVKEQVIEKKKEIVVKPAEKKKGRPTKGKK